MPQTRKLAAIQADVAGYSRLAGDEDGRLRSSGRYGATRYDRADRSRGICLVSHNLRSCEWDPDDTLFRRRLLRHYVNVDLPI